MVVITVALCLTASQKLQEYTSKVSKVFKKIDKEVPNELERLKFLVGSTTELLVKCKKFNKKDFHESATIASINAQLEKATACVEAIDSRLKNYQENWSSSYTWRSVVHWGGADADLEKMKKINDSLQEQTDMLMKIHVTELYKTTSESTILDTFRAWAAAVDQSSSIYEWFYGVAKESDVPLKTRQNDDYRTPQDMALNSLAKIVKCDRERIKQGAELEEKIELVMNFCIVGDSGVGKSSLMMRGAGHPFSSTYISTIGLDYTHVHAKYKEMNVKIKCWDTSGQKRYYRDITKEHLLRTNFTSVIMICYCMDDQNSFDNLSFWLREVKNVSSDFKGRRRNHIVAIVGNKLDMESERKVKYKELKSFVEEWNKKGNYPKISHYAETSAKNGTNCKALFTKLSTLKLEQDFHDATRILARQGVTMGADGASFKNILLAKGFVLKEQSWMNSYCSIL